MTTLVVIDRLRSAQLDKNNAEDAGLFLWGTMMRQCLTSYLALACIMFAEHLGAQELVVQTGTDDPYALAIQAGNRSNTVAFAWKDGDRDFQTAEIEQELAYIVPVLQEHEFDIHWYFTFDEDFDGRLLGVVGGIGFFRPQDMSTRAFFEKVVLELAHSRAENASSRVRLIESVFEKLQEICKGNFDECYPAYIDGATRKVTVTEAGIRPVISVMRIHNYDVLLVENCSLSNSSTVATAINERAEEVLPSWLSSDQVIQRQPTEIGGLECVPVAVPITIPRELDSESFETVLQRTAEARDFVNSINRFAFSSERVNSLFK